MTPEAKPENERRMTSVFERYLTLWVGLCIVGGILLGKLAPNLNDAVRSFVRGSPGDRCRGVDRSAGHADAGRVSV